MDERTFGTGGYGGDDGRLDDERATAEAAELAERIIEQIARADHDWALIGTLAGGLAALAERAVSGRG